MATKILLACCCRDAFASYHHALQLAKSIDASEFEIHLAVLTGKNRLRHHFAADSDDSVAAISHRYGSWASVSRLRRLIQRIRPAAVQSLASPIHSVVQFAAHSCHIPCVLYHDTDGLGSLPAADRWLRNWLRPSTAVVVPQTYFAKSVDGRVPSSAIYTIPAYPLLQTSAMERATVLQRLGLPENAVWAAGVGPLSADSRWKDLIWATDLLRVVDDRFHMVIFGEPTTPEDRWRLERFRSQVEIADKVHFAPALLDLPEVLSHADMLWSATKRNRYSPWLASGLALGIPIVASNTSAHSELFSANERTAVVPFADRAAYAKATWQWLKAGVTRAIRANNAATADDIASQWQNVLKTASQPQTGSPAEQSTV
ncbi:MAG: glycosyltransferase [Pirellulaceae bacterium]